MLSLWKQKSYWQMIDIVVVYLRNGLRSAYCKFSQLWDSQTTLLTPFSCFIALWKHTCRPIKTHVLSRLMTWAIWFALSPSCEKLQCHKRNYGVQSASCIVFLFVKTENNNFIKEIKHVIRAFIPLWKPWQSLWEFSSTDVKTETQSRVFTDLLLNSPKHSPRFSTRLWRQGEHKP